MKRITVLTLTLLILMIGSLSAINTVVGTGPHSTNIETTSDIGLDQETASDAYYPIFYDVNTTETPEASIIRDRNDTLGEGAIVQVQEFANITFTYAVALLNTSTFSADTVDFQLFGDLPFVNTTNFNNTATHVDLSLSGSTSPVSFEYTNTNSTEIDYIHPYTGDVLDNATLYFFQSNIVVNMSASYLPFYVKDVNLGGLGENLDDGAYNLLTAEVTTPNENSPTHFTTEPQEELFIQTEIVNITGNTYLANDTGDALAIQYQVNGGSSTTTNFTLTYGASNENGTGILSLGKYEAGTEITWDSVFYAFNDTLINLTRTISNIDSKSLIVGDGTPQLTLDVDPNSSVGLYKDGTVYSSNFSITFVVTATVPKGLITTLDLYPEDSASESPFDPVNSSLTDVELAQTVDYTDFTESSDGGNFNATIFAETDKGLSLNQTVKVVIDTVNPEIASIGAEGGNTITTSDGSVTFNFAYSDDNSGVKRAILDLGNGESVEVTGMETFTHRYQDFDDASYDYKLTVIDFAGNIEVSDVQTLTLERSQFEYTSAPFLGILLFFAVLVGLLTSPWWGPVVSEKVLNR